MDYWFGHGRSVCSCRFGIWIRYWADFHVSLVSVHQVATPSYARGFHLQCLRPTHHPSHQSACLYWWHCFCPGLYIFSNYWASIMNELVIMIPLSFLKVCLILDANAFILFWVVLWMQCIPQAGGQFEPVSRDEVLCESKLQPQCEQWIGYKVLRPEWGRGKWWYLSPFVRWNRRINVNSWVYITLVLWGKVVIVYRIDIST